MNAPATVLPFASRSRDTKPDPDELRQAIEACGASVARMQAALDAHVADMTEHATDLAICHARLRSVLGGTVQ